MKISFELAKNVFKKDKMANHKYVFKVNYLKTFTKTLNTQCQSIKYSIQSQTLYVQFRIEAQQLIRFWNKFW